MRHTLVRAAAFALAVTALPALAQDRSNTRGILLGVQGAAASIQLDEEGAGEAERGIGGGVTLGYGVTGNITVFLRGNLAAIDYSGEEGSYDLSTVDLAGRYSFGTSAAALRPYVELGLTGTAVRDEIEGVEVVLAGGGLNLGGGLEYFLQRNLALDIGLALGKGQITSAEVDGEDVGEFDNLDFTTTRLSAGLNLRL